MSDDSRSRTRQRGSSAGASAARESQRERVHRLSNLGGLVVLAGLESTAPDLLLGLLLGLAERLPQVTPSRLEEVARRGAARLRARGAEKRAWTNHRRAVDVHRLDLTRAELEQAFHRLGEAPPSELSTWTRALRDALLRADARGSRRG